MKTFISALALASSITPAFAVSCNPDTNIAALIQNYVSNAAGDKKVIYHNVVDADKIRAALVAYFKTQNVVLPEEMNALAPAIGSATFFYGTGVIWTRTYFFDAEDRLCGGMQVGKDTFVEILGTLTR